VAFAILVAAVIVLALVGKNANRSSYIIIAIGAVLVAVWALQQ
jgi:hypothetical protein